MSVSSSASILDVLSFTRFREEKLSQPLEAKSIRARELADVEAVDDDVDDAGVDGNPVQPWHEAVFRSFLECNLRSSPSRREDGRFIVLCHCLEARDIRLARNSESLAARLSNFLEANICLSDGARFNKGRAGGREFSMFLMLRAFFCSF